MSMNQLHGKYVNVVLTVEEGRGMGFIRSSFYISANLNGRILVSDSVEPCANPRFSTELVWEIEKKDLRKIRSTNQPLKIECLTRKSPMNNDKNNKEERIGFALLSLRGAKIVISPENTQVVWLKFIGVHDKKSCQPELSIALTIQEHMQHKEIFNPNETVMPYISEEEIKAFSDESSGDTLSETKTTSIKYHEKGFIQIGGRSANERFSLNLLVKATANLDLLLPECIVFGKTRQKFRLTFKIFGVVIKSNTFDTTLNDVIEMNEKIVVKLLSNKTTILEFLKTQKILISFCCGNEKLGITHIDLSKLMLPDDDDEILECHETCFFKFPSKNGIVPSNGDMKPYMEIQSSLLKDNGESGKPSGDNINVKSKEQDKKISTIKKASGDQTLVSPPSKKKTKADLPQSLKKSESESTPKEPIVDEPILQKCCLNEIKRLKIGKNERGFKKYCLEVALKDLSIINEDDWKDQFCLKVLHPKSACYLVNSNPKEETYNKFRIQYFSMEDRVRNVLDAWPPKIQLLNHSKDRTLTEYHAIDTNNLFHKNNSKSNLFQDDDLLLSTYHTVLKCRETEKECVRFEVVMSLTECPLEIELTANPLDLTPPIIDEELTIREIIDLEKWKNEEKNTIRKKLSTWEEEEREKTREELKRSMEKADEMMQQQLAKCRDLQDELKDKVNALKTEKLLKKRKNALSSNALNNIKEKVGQKYSNCNKELLTKVINKLEVDNQALRDIITQQNEELRNNQKSALTKEQTANLLQELKGLEKKFEGAQIAKGFFKSQWKKSYEEVHELRTKDYENLQAELKESKELLSQLSLDGLIDGTEDSNDLYDDLDSDRTFVAENFY